MRKSIYGDYYDSIIMTESYLHRLLNQCIFKPGPTLQAINVRDHSLQLYPHPPLNRKHVSKWPPSLIAVKPIYWVSCSYLLVRSYQYCNISYHVNFFTHGYAYSCRSVVHDCERSIVICNPWKIKGQLFMKDKFIVANGPNGVHLKEFHCQWRMKMFLDGEGGAAVREHTYYETRQI